MFDKIPLLGFEGLRKDKLSPAFAVVKRGNTKNESNRAECKYIVLLTAIANEH